MCGHRLNGGALECDRKTPHAEDRDGGHTYAASDVPQTDDTEAVQD